MARVSLSETRGISWPLKAEEKPAEPKRARLPSKRPIEVQHGDSIARIDKHNVSVRRGKKADTYQTFLLVEAHVLRQPRVVHAWVVARAQDDYARFGFKPDDCDWRACVDAIAWQRMTGGRGAAEFVADLPGNEESGL